MNELIPIHSATLQNDTVSTVNARDLHTFLEVGKDFSNWIKDRIQQYGFVEGTDYLMVFAKTGENPEPVETGDLFCSPKRQSRAKRGGRPAKNYHLTMDMAKELSMVERNVKGKQARLYFIECERRAKMAVQPAPADPKNLSRMQLIQLALDAETERLALEQQVLEQAPKVAFHDAVANAVNCQTVEEVSKVFGTGRNRLFAFMRSDGMLMRNNLPYQKHIDAGHFKVVECHRTDPRGEGYTSTRTLITGKGLTYIQRRLQAPLPLMQHAH